MKGFKALSLTFTDVSLEKAYRRLRDKSRFRALLVLVLGQILVLLVQGKAAELTGCAVVLALGSLLSPSTVVALGLYVLLYTLILTQSVSDLRVVCLLSLLQIYPGIDAFPGFVRAYLVQLLSVYTYLSLNLWSDGSDAHMLVRVLCWTTACWVILLWEIVRRIRFAYGDFASSGISRFKAILDGLQVPVVVVTTNQVLYFNEASEKFLQGHDIIHISRKLTSFQLLNPTGNLSSSRNQPFWTEVNALLNKSKAVTVNLRDYTFHRMETAPVKVAISGRFQDWEIDSPALILTFTEFRGDGGLRTESKTDFIPLLTEEMRAEINEIYANLKVQKQLHSEATFDALEKSLLCHYYGLYTVFVRTI